MNQIKKLDLASKRVSTIAGTGKAGFKDGPSLAAQVLHNPTCVILVLFNVCFDF